MPTEELTERFHDSLERCQQNRGFLDAFYDRFLAASPEIPSYFANTDFNRQKQVLTMSFYHLLSATAGNPESHLHIQRIAGGSRSRAGDAQRHPNASG